MRVTVALGSRLRGNDEGAARERRVMQRSPFAGARGGGTGRRVMPSRERRGGGTGTSSYVSLRGGGRPGEVAVGVLGWDASDRCAGFPPSRERRGGGTGTSSYVKVSLRGGGRPGEVAVGVLGWDASDRCAGFPNATAHPRPSRERRGSGTGTSSYVKDAGAARERRVMQRSPFAGKTEEADDARQN